MDKIRILYIAYYFPPLGGVASLRSLKMIKYLDKLGIECTVLTTKAVALNYPKDPSLCKEIPTSTKIYRFFCPDLSWLYKALYGLKLHRAVKWLSQRLFVPDNYVLGLKFAQSKLDKILSEDTGISLSVISSGPPSSLFLGMKLKKKYGLHFICDFRDEWTNNPERLNISYPHRSQTRELLWEARILSTCNGVSYLSKLMKDNFQRRYPFLKDKASRIISNGFDEDDFTGIDNTQIIKDKLHILYCGSFYDRRQPDKLWQALKELIQNGSITPQDLRIEILGKNNQSFVYGSFYHDPDICAMLEFTDFKPHKETVKAMLASDALLLYIPSGLNADSVLTGKVFDYIRSGRPILTIAPPKGLAAEIVIQSKLGFVADYDDIAGIKEQVMKLLTAHRKADKGIIEANWDYIRGFSREAQAAKMADLIRELHSR